MTFVIQFLFAWLYYSKKISGGDPQKSLSTPQRMARLIGFNLMQVACLIGNVSTFRGFWNIYEAFFIPNDLYLSTTFSQIIGLAYILLFYAGTSLHGGVRRDNQNVLIPNFFLTYLLSNKID